MARQNLPPRGSFAAAGAPQGSRFQKFTQQNQSNRPEKRHGIDLA
jgi:hypothetical protein